MTYTSQLRPPTTPVRSRRGNLTRLVALLCTSSLCLALLAGFAAALGWLSWPTGVGLVPVRDAHGILVARQSGSVELFHAGQLVPQAAPAASDVSLSPSGLLLLEDGRQIVSTKNGQIVSYIQAVVPVPGLVQSLWLTPNTVLLGSTQQAGLYAVNLQNSGTATKVSQDCGLGSLTSAAVSSDGKLLLCTSRRDTLGILDLSSAPTYHAIAFNSPFTAVATYISSPTWSPGRRITFALAPAPGDSTPPELSEIVNIGQDGSDLVVLAPASSGHFCVLPTWSPNGEQLAYVNIDERTPGAFSFAVHVLTVSTRGDRVIATGPGSGPKTMSWSPDGAYLAYDGDSLLWSHDLVSIVQMSSRRHIVVSSGATLAGWTSEEK